MRLSHQSGPLASSPKVMSPELSEQDLSGRVIFLPRGEHFPHGRFLVAADCAFRYDGTFYAFCCHH